MDRFKRIMADLFTGLDGSTHDLGRWSWAGSMGAVLVATSYNALHGALIDLNQLAQALGTVAGVHGAVLWAKKDTEPPKGQP